MSKSVMRFIHTVVSIREIVNNGKNLKQESKNLKGTIKLLSGAGGVCVKITVFLGSAHNPPCELSPNYFCVLCPPVHSLWQSIQSSRNYYKGHKEK